MRGKLKMHADLYVENLKGGDRLEDLTKLRR
jgi:hypothetical protein